MENLQQYLRRKKINLTQDEIAAIKELVEAYDNFNRENLNNHCSFCNKKLTIHELHKVNEFDFNIVCDKHREYKDVIQTIKVRERLGTVGNFKTFFDEQ